MKSPLLHIILKKFYLFKLAKSIYFLLNKIQILKKYKTKTGIYYLPLFAFKDGIKNEIINNKIFDEHVYLAGKVCIEPNSIVIDAGANYGQYSILFSKVKEDVEVYSFEANYFVYKILNKNVKINNANVKTFNNLLGDVSKSIVNVEKIELQTADYGSQSFNIKSGKNTDKIQAIKLDDFIFEKKISLLKVDVEGMDYNVLLGAKNTIIRNKMPIIFEFIKSKSHYSFQHFENFIDEINYFIEKKIDENNFLIRPKNRS